jgi:hypothetical protein
MHRSTSALVSLSLLTGTAGLAFTAPAFAEEIPVTIPFTEPAVASQHDANATAEAAIGKTTTDPATKLAEIKAKGSAAITQRQTTLSNLTTKMGQQTRDCGSNAVMSSQIASTSSSLTTVGTNLAASTDVAAARTLHRSIFIDHRVYLLVAPKTNKVLRCNSQLVRNDALNAEGAKLQQSINEAAAKGVNVSAAQAAKDAAMTSLSAINPAPALSAIMGLVPDKGDKTLQASNTAALNQADAALDATLNQQKAVNAQFGTARKLLADARGANRSAVAAQRKNDAAARKAARATTVPAVVTPAAPVAG